GVPEMCLAVDAAEPAGINKCGAVEQHAVGDLAEAAHDDDPLAGGQPRPERDRLAVGRLRAGSGLLAALEDVAAGDQLGQDDNTGAPPGGVCDGVGGELTICCRVAEHGGELAAGHDCGVHGIDLPALCFTPIWAGGWPAGMMVSHGRPWGAPRDG